MSLTLEPNDFKIGTIKGLKKKYLNETELDNLQEIIFNTWGYKLIEEMNEYYFDKIIIVTLTSKGFKKFKSILPHLQYKIIGYMFVNMKRYKYMKDITASQRPKCHLIEAIHSLVNGLNIGSLLTNYYATHKNKILVPRLILEDSVEYWRKYLKEKFNLNTSEEYKTFIKNNNLEGITNWSSYFY